MPRPFHDVRSRRYGSALAIVVAVAAGIPSVGAHEPDAQPLVVIPGTVPHHRGQQGRETDLTELLAKATQTAGQLGVFRQTIAPGSGPPLHVHDRELEFAYVISGKFRFKLGDRVLDVPPGTFVSIPKHTPHAFRNVGTTPGVLLFGVTPGGLEQMFDEREGVDKETNQKLMEQHRMRVVGPPLN